MTEHNEGSPWFWKIFGGTIMGAIVFLLLAHITNINSSIEGAKNETKVEITELRTEIKDLRVLLDGNKERIVALEQNNLREKIISLEQSLKETNISLDKKNQQITSLETITLHLKEELKSIQEKNAKLVEQLQQIREKIAVSEESKKE